MPKKDDTELHFFAYRIDEQNFGSLKAKFASLNHGTPHDYYDLYVVEVPGLSGGLVMTTKALIQNFDVAQEMFDQPFFEMKPRTLADYQALRLEE